MANLDKPYGARVVGHLDGSPFNDMVSLMNFAAAEETDTFIGDFVNQDASATASGIRLVKQAAADENLLGVLIGLEPDPTDLRTLYRKLDTLRNCYVADSPDIVFEMQEDAVGGALAAADIGNNIDIIVGAGDTTLGLSGMELDSNTAATTTFQIRILSLIQNEDEIIGANASYRCMVNEHVYKSTTGE